MSTAKELGERIKRDLKMYDTSGALRYAPPGFGGRREVGRYVCFPVGGAA